MFYANLFWKINEFFTKPLVVNIQYIRTKYKIHLTYKSLILKKIVLQLNTVNVAIIQNYKNNWNQTILHGYNKTEIKIENIDKI